MPNAGFSLLELLISICLMAILASVSIAFWNETKWRNELATTTEQLVYFLNEIQMVAHTQNSTYHLYLFDSPWCLLATKDEKPTACQGDLSFMKPYASVDITEFTDKKIVSFWGKRNMAQTSHFQLQNEIGISKVIISFRGRIRGCSQNTYLSGIPKC